ncbi:MAG TPA: DUF4337 domain-containing protein [Bryobacteraceae bacterium]|nr:DUF4337 domain-containing protein [Bryobacteraceae bacterium]
MSAQEEVEEHVHHAHDPFDKTVAGTMAIIAAFLAVVSVLAQHFNTEKLLLQGKVSDTWAYSQAKDIRHYVAQATRDSLKDLKPGSAMVNTYDQDAKRYKKEAAQIQDQARDLEKERDAYGERADRFHFGEVFLEIAIVLSSLSILTKRKPFFWAGAMSAVAGVVIGITAYWA